MLLLECQSGVVGWPPMISPQSLRFVRIPDRPQIMYSIMTSVSSTGVGGYSSAQAAFPQSVSPVHATPARRWSDGLPDCLQNGTELALFGPKNCDWSIGI